MNNQRDLQRLDLTPVSLLYREVRTSKGIVHWVSVEDADLAQRHRWSENSDGYAQCRVQGKTLFLHRLVMSAVLKRDLVRGDVVDHRDGCKRNHTRGNLRLATVAQNALNRGANKNNVLGLKNISRRLGRNFEVIVRVGGVRHRVGSFVTKEEAIAARDAFVAAHHGEFARLIKNIAPPETLQRVA